MKQLNYRMLRSTIFLIPVFLFSIHALKAQTATDAIMMDKGQFCLDVMYNHDSWTEYWEGTKKRSNDNIGTFTRHTVGPMIDLGITHRINVLAGFAYVVTDPSAGQIAGSQGFQNMNLDVKVNALETDLGPGKFSVLATLGFMTPISNYAPDEPFAIGLGCTEISLRPIVQYKLNKGFYARAQAGYNFRSNCKLNHDYYFTTQQYFSDEVDMPNAIDYSATLGYFAPSNAFKAEATFDGFNTLGGFDMRIQDMPFPSNQMIYTRVGGLFHYYPSFVKGLGVHVSASYVLSGRNVGQTTAIGGGINYTFQLWNKATK